MYIKLFCPAKVNLFLEVLDKREDMYHNLDTVMQSVNLCDTVCVDVCQNDGAACNKITVRCDSDKVPDGKENIAYRAAELFLSSFDIRGYNIDITIEKKIPVQAGLAGGSADCAGVLTALERLFELKKEHERILTLAATLGADVPFCMKGGCAHAGGKGEKLSSLPSITPDYTFLVAKAGMGVSTGEAYSYMDGPRNKKSSEALVSHLRTGNISAMCFELYNAFERVVCPRRPMVELAKEVMNSSGALGSLMSGSGPSVFGIFAVTDDAEAAHEQLIKLGYDAHVCFALM